MPGVLSTIDPNRNTCLDNPAPMQVTATAISQVLLPADFHRRAVVFTNLGIKNVWIAFGPHAAVVNRGIPLFPGVTLALGANNVPVEAISMICDIVAGPDCPVACQEFF